ncbi:MAG: hypothetical protein WCB71_12380 [Aestuariivirga sp.]
MISRRSFLLITLIGGIFLPQRSSFAMDSPDSNDNEREDRSDGDDPGGGDDGGNDDGGDGQGGDDHGGDSQSGDGESDQDRILDAVRNNNAVSLKDIMSVVRSKYSGEIVNVSLSGSQPNLIYHIKLLDSGNRLVELSIDSVTSAILEVGGP